MKGKTHIIAKFLRTDLVICSHSREGETLSYSLINTVLYLQTQLYHFGQFKDLPVWQHHHFLMPFLKRETAFLISSDDEAAPKWGLLMILIGV